jgi:hypothetical protein
LGAFFQGGAFLLALLAFFDAPSIISSVIEAVKAVVARDGKGSRGNFAKASHATRLSTKRSTRRSRRKQAVGFLEKKLRKKRLHLYRAT